MEESGKAACGQGNINCPFLQEDRLDELAEKAAERAIAKMTSHVYQEVGKSVIEKMFYLIGALAFGLYLWAQSKGILP